MAKVYLLLVVAVAFLGSSVGFQVSERQTSSPRLGSSNDDVVGVTTT